MSLCFNATWNCLVFQTTPSVRLSRHLYLFLNVTQDNKRSATPAGSPARTKSPERFLHTPQISISSLVRRAKEAERQARTLVRPPRTPVRRSRNHSESRDSRSRSPLSRSSSVESAARDESPLNFNAALDMDSKRAFSEDEDAEGDGKKISAAQYETFRQAVTSSKGTYKINPAKTKRAARASLLDLGETEVPDRVSWLDQPSLQDTMASTARIAQGLKEGEEVVKTTLSETLNDNTSSFKFFTVKHIFPSEPYRLKIHRDALYAPKPPGDHGFIDNKTPSSYHLSHRVCLDPEELARRSAIYASLADSMVASVIEELSPKDERSKLLREKLTIIQEAQVSAVSAGFAAASNLQLLRRDALLRNFNFQPPVLSAVRTAPFEGHHVVGPEPKVLQTRVRAIRQADRLISDFRQAERIKTSTKTSSKKTAPRLPCLTGWAPLHPQRRGRSHRSRPFQLAPEGPVHDPSKEARSLASLLLLPQPRNVDGSQVGAHLADFAPHWRSLLGNCRATSIVEDGVGIAFQQRPQLTHQSISFRTRNNRQDLQQAVDALLMKGAIERVTNVRSLGFYSRLFLVPKKTGDLRPVIDLSTLNRHMVVPHFKMETQGSVRSAIRSQEWAVSIDIRDAYLHVPMHQAVRKYLRFVVNKKVYQFTCLPFGLATSPREFTKLLRPVVLLLRQQGVKLHVCLDDWLIRADTPEEAQLHAQTTIKVLQFLGWIINFEKSDLTPSQDFQFIGMQFNTRCFTVAPLPKMRVKVQSVHQHWMANPNITARDLHRLLGMLVFMASLVRRGQLRLRPVQWWAATAWCQRTGNWSDRIQVPQWVLSEVAWWSSPAVLQSLPLAARETEVTLDTGTVVSISTIVPHKRSRDAGCHLCCERLPTSSEVPSGATDVRQCSDGGVHQERGGHEIAHFDADDHTAAQVVRQQGNYVGSRPSARNAQHPGGFPVQSRPDTDHRVDDGHGESTTRVCQVGRTTDRYVCDIRQQKTRQVRIAISGPQGGVDRCHVHALGQGEGPLVRLPVIQDGPASSAEDRSITRSAGDTDRSTATGSIMVSRADGPSPRRPGSPVRGRSRPADTRRVHGRGRDRDSSLPAVKSSRLETLRAILRAKGHSREAANMMSRCLRESSQQVYESHWSRFVAFCRTKRWQVFRVGSHHFSTYMMHLFRDGLLPSTIISHRMSVASVLCHWVYNPAADPHIKLLVRAFRLERPVQRRIMPKWDLHLVLLSLMRPPFTSQSEDDGESSDDVIPLKWRTLKCLFLLALASARRRSYLHALSIAPGRCVFARGNTQRQLVVSLLPEPGFLAKNQLPAQAPEWITVPGIAHLNPTEPERMLCPVRQLKLYIRDSERIRGGRQRMFIHWNHSIRDIMRSHISRWIVETVKEAYTQADRQYDRVTAHEVRALSASWAYNCQVALPDILSAAFWRSSGVFQKSYLRDMMYCWGHVDTGSSGGRTTRRGSRTSSPTSIAYTICMQPLLRRS